MKRHLWFAGITVLAVVIAGNASKSWAQSATGATPGPQAFAPLDQWRAAVLAGDAASLKSLYSTTPAMQVKVGQQQSDASAETSFWIGLKPRNISLDVIQSSSTQPSVQVIVFQAEVKTAAAADQTLYITEAQAWQQQAGQWHLVVVTRTEPAHLKQPPNKDKNIYPADAHAREEIQDAEKKASQEHKRVLLVFGANWCYDCHVLDLAFQRPDFEPVVARYEVVHVDIGPDGKKNADVAKQFDVPLNKGVPALAVVESNGKLVVSQKNGEFENARAMTPEALLQFLNKWKI
jgi:thiol-disulfide isomerase/thioredoxin